jgi:hypothetical protein
MRVSQQRQRSSPARAAPRAAQRARAPGSHRPAIAHVPLLRAQVLFTFEVLDLQHDLIVASSPAYGEVGLLVAPMDRENGTIPGCSMACGGCQVVCANYTVRAAPLSLRMQAA